MSQQHPSQNVSFLDIIWRFKLQLLMYIIVISFITFFGLYMVGGIPEELKGANTAPTTQEQPVVSSSQATTSPVQPIVRPSATSLLQPSSTAGAAGQSKGELPIRVIIDKIGVNTSVHNPASSDINVLNNELLKGAVRYPGSGTLGQGNMFIFGHSTSLKIVNNQAFKAFNRTKELNLGDIIRVRSTTKEYTYKVTSVSLVDSEKQFVDLKTDKNMLTISTCNVLGEKEERFLVEAVFVKSQSI